MNLTFGFIAFFLSIVIPGILFRRFFYYGEFSKQFDSKDPVLHSIFYSIVPGICIQVICFVLADAIFSFNIPNTDIFNIFKDFVYSGEKEINNSTISFLESGLDTFIYYSLTIFFISIVAGHSIARLLRFFKLDIKFKILKFKNQWFYIFSGEILQFEKFEFGRNITISSNEPPHNQKISTTYADVLVDNTEGIRELYTGYVVDYDLCSEDISQLERIYLLDTYRYKKIKPVDKPEEKDEEIKAEDTEISQEDVQKEVEKKSRIRRKIPGDIFVISGKHILNINLTYVPSEKKGELKEANRQKFYNKLSIAFLIVAISIIILSLVLENIAKPDSAIDTFFKESNLFAKFIVFIFIIQFLSIFSPSWNKKDSKYGYSLKGISTKVVILIFLYALMVICMKISWLPSELPLLFF